MKISSLKQDNKVHSHSQYQVASDCTSIGYCCSCRVNKFREFGENSSKAFSTHTSLITEKDKVLVSVVSVGDSK
jgi:hypothetical protein